MNDDYDRVRAVLTRAVAKVCPPHLASQREDIVQNALMRILEIQRRGEQQTIRTSSYLWQAAYTATIDEIRRLTRRREVSLEDGAADGQTEEMAPAPGADESSRLLGLELRDCLARIAPPRRRAVGLYLFGFRAEEAAPVFGGNLKQVRNLTYRGLADLRVCLEAKGLKP